MGMAVMKLHCHLDKMQILERGNDYTRIFGCHIEVKEIPASEYFKYFQNFSGRVIDRIIRKSLEWRLTKNHIRIGGQCILKVQEYLVTFEHHQLTSKDG